MDTAQTDGWQTYRKRPITVSVAFAVDNRIVETIEGPVACKSGDAVVTGVAGEKWPVPIETFLEKYIPAAHTQPGQPGLYLPVPHPVRAMKLTEIVMLNLGQERGSIAGAPGDWLVQYGPDEHGIVQAKIFEQTYEPV